MKPAKIFAQHPNILLNLPRSSADPTNVSPQTQSFERYIKNVKRSN